MKKYEVSYVYDEEEVEPEGYVAEVEAEDVADAMRIVREKFTPIIILDVR